MLNTQEEDLHAELVDLVVSEITTFEVTPGGPPDRPWWKVLEFESRTAPGLITIDELVMGFESEQLDVDAAEFNRKDPKGLGLVTRLGLCLENQGLNGLMRQA